MVLLFSCNLIMGDTFRDDFLFRVLKYPLIIWMHALREYVLRYFVYVLMLFYSLVFQTACS